MAQIQTGAPNSKFGFPIQDGQARAAAIEIAQDSWLELCGVHCHIGSQITDLTVYAELIHQLSILVLALESEDISCKVLNVGGGLGVMEYQADQSNPTPEEWAKTIFSALDTWFGGKEDKHSLMIEPGRAIVARCGVTLYKVAVRKTLANGQQALIVDGGMSDNPRPALYEALYVVEVASRCNQPPDGQYWIFGRHCETDLLFRAALPDPQVGDVLIVYNTGAYTYSMASNYNRFTKPAVVLTNEKSTRIIAQREPLEHVLDLDM